MTSSTPANAAKQELPFRKQELPFHYGSRLLQLCKLKQSSLLLGLDPNVDLLPPYFLPLHKKKAPAILPALKPAAQLSQTAAQLSQAAALLALQRYCEMAMQTVAAQIVGVKLQSAFFEIYGAAGIAVLQHLCEFATKLGLLVILDVKRGDVPSTAKAYAKAYLGTDSVWAVDAITIHPFFGFDTVAPFANAALAAGKGLYVCVKTSNPGSVALQSLQVMPRGGEEGGGKQENAAPQTFFAAVAMGLQPFAQQLSVGELAPSSLGVVVGATFASSAALVRASLPNAPMLVPGYGAQGGEIKQLSSFAGNASLFPLSRALLYPWASFGKDGDGGRVPSR